MAYGQYRYWRIRFISTQGAASARIARIQFKNAIGGVDWTIQNWGVSDTGYQDTNSNNAADSSTATNWITGQSTVTNAWVGARIYGGPAQIQEIVITATNDVNFAGAPSAFWVEGSNDTDGALPVNWTRLAYCGAATWTQGSSQTFDFYAVQATDTAKITRVSADVAYSAARTARLSAVQSEVLTKATSNNIRLSAVQVQALLSNIDVTGSGSLMTTTSSLIAGSASVLSGDATATGGTLAWTASVLSGAVTGGATGAGGTLAWTASIIAGAAAADESLSGVTLAATYSVIPGAAVGGGIAVAPGDTVASTDSLIVGAASGTANVSGGLLTDTLSLIPGAASANAVVPPQTLVISYPLLNGLVTGTANLDGQTFVEAITLIPGAVSVNSTARGNVLPFTPSLIKGAVTVDTEVLGKVIHVDFSLPENTLGTVRGDANTPEIVVPFSHQVVAVGTATGTAVARGQIVAFSHLVLNGALHTDANIDASATFVVSVTLDPGHGFSFLGSPGDVMVEPHADTRMELLAEIRELTVSVETRAIIVPHEERAMALGPRLKKVI